MSGPIGVIAGEGRLPLEVARGARRAGRTVVGVGLRGQFDPQFPELCDRFAQAGVIRLGRWIALLRRFGAEEAVLVGRVKKARMYDPLLWLRYAPDWRAARIWYRVLRGDRRGAAVLNAVADELASKGVRLIETTRYIPETLAELGPMTVRRTPSVAQRRDIDFGVPLCLQMGAFDIGQALAVKDCEVIAVEAIEGTDRMIERAGALCRSGGWTLIKMAKPIQDLRLDVPTIGPRTIRKLKEAGAGCLALEAGKVIMVEKAAVLAEAERAGIAVVGVAAASGPETTAE